MADTKKSKETHISLDLNEVLTISSTDHPGTSIIIKNSKGTLMVTLDDTQNEKKSKIGRKE